MNQHKPKVDLIVIGIIVLVLVLGVGLIVKPGDVFKEAENITRNSHMQLLMTAVYTYAAEHKGAFPDCLPGINQPAKSMRNCYDELQPYLLHLELIEPDSRYSYMIEHISGERGEMIRIFSTAPQAKNLEVIR